MSQVVANGLLPLKTLCALISFSPGNNPEHRPTVLPMDYGTPYMRNEEIEPEEKASPVAIKPNPYGEVIRYCNIYFYTEFA